MTLELVSPDFSRHFFIYRAEGSYGYVNINRQGKMKIVSTTPDHHRELEEVYLGLRLTIHKDDH